MLGAVAGRGMPFSVTWRHSLGPHGGAWGRMGVAKDHMVRAITYEYGMVVCTDSPGFRGTV